MLSTVGASGHVTSLRKARRICSLNLFGFEPLDIPGHVAGHMHGDGQQINDTTAALYQAWGESGNGIDTASYVRLLVTPILNHRSYLSKVAGHDAG